MSPGRMVDGCATAGAATRRTSRPAGSIRRMPVIDASSVPGKRPVTCGDRAPLLPNVTTSHECVIARLALWRATFARIMSEGWRRGRLHRRPGSLRSGRGSPWTGVIVLANQLDADSMTPTEPPLPNLLGFIAEGQGILSLAGARTARRSLSGTEGRCPCFPESVDGGGLCGNRVGAVSKQRWTRSWRPRLRHGPRPSVVGGRRALAHVSGTDRALRVAIGQRRRRKRPRPHDVGIGC